MKSVIGSFVVVFDGASTTGGEVVHLEGGNVFFSPFGHPDMIVAALIVPRAIAFYKDRQKAHDLVRDAINDGVEKARARKAEQP